MRVVDIIAQILKREGVQYMPCYPTTLVMEAAAAVGIKPIISRQERVGMGIADGFSRVSNGRPVGVFAMQYGPGAENAFAGVATAYSDSVPVLVIPLGHTTDKAGVLPHFNSMRVFGPVTKSVEEVNIADRVGEVMRRAFSNLCMGPPGPVMVEIPADVATQEVEESAVTYQPIKAARTAGNPRDVDQAARVLVEAKRPLIHAGQGVLYAEASGELVQLAELLQAPVMTTLAGKSAFPENHSLSLGTGALTATGPVVHFLPKADVLLGIGCSLTRHPMEITIPPNKVIIQVTNNPRDFNKDYTVNHPIEGDARLVLGQLIEAVTDRLGGRYRDGTGVAQEIRGARDNWLVEWMPKLTSDEVAITPYRIIWELIRTVNPADAIVTHDSGGPRDQIVPFYQATVPRCYLGWGKSHGLGTGLGLTMGAKLAAPDKLAIHWMGDAAFGMVGLDFETAVRCGIPIMVLVSNNSIMATEERQMAISHKMYRTRDITGNYADMARAMGGYAERVESPSEIGPAIQRARRATEDGQAALLEFITSHETACSYKRAFG